MSASLLADLEVALGLATIASGVFVIALAVVRRGRRRARVPVPAAAGWCDCGRSYCAHGVLPVALGGPDVPVAQLRQALADAAPSRRPPIAEGEDR